MVFFLLNLSRINISGNKCWYKVDKIIINMLIYLLKIGYVLDLFYLVVYFYKIGWYLKVLYIV